MKTASKVLMKLHAPGGTNVLALCDKELLGKVFESGDLVLDLKAYRKFYEGELVGEGVVVAALEKSPNVNAVGERSVELVCKVLGASKSCAKRIGGVPHLQAYRV